MADNRAPVPQILRDWLANVPKQPTPGSAFDAGFEAARQRVATIIRAHDEGFAAGVEAGGPGVRS